jgi:carboxylesterase type B
MSPSFKSVFVTLSLLGGIFTIPATVITCPKPDKLIDLGYAKHVPTYVDTTFVNGHRVSVYKNIRYANAPTGNLRFRKPDTNLLHIEGIQKGDEPYLSRSCISTVPAQAPFPDINGTTWGQDDCLFLDVYVPEGVKPGDGVPVLHLFHGSAFLFGSKETFLNPIGLFDGNNTENNFIFVANNYR